MDSNTKPYNWLDELFVDRRKSFSCSYDTSGRLATSRRDVERRARLRLFLRLLRTRSSLHRIIRSTFRRFVQSCGSRDSMRTAPASVARVK
jgi:hypothetical protein